MCIRDRHLPAPASTELPVLLTPGFLLNTTTRKSLRITTCCFCPIWKMQQLYGEHCLPTWGPFLKRSILFGPISGATGCHKSCPIFKVTTFHFKSSNFKISPLFSRLKHVTRPHFKMSFLIGSVGSYHNVPSDWLRKQSTHSKKTTERMNPNP